MSSLIRAEHLTHLYPAQPEPIAALRDVSLDIGSGDYVAIVGANGSGKSTLARHLNALLLPTEGEVWVAGASTADASQLRAIRGNVAMVFQNPENQFVATVAQEDVAFGPENFGVPVGALKVRVEEALQAVGLEPLRDRAPHELSAGQQQRLAIAGALAIRPQVLVLDEATAMLDPQGKAAVMELAEELHERGLTIAAITQSMEEAAQAARVIVMDKGEVVADGAPREVFSPALSLPEELGLPLKASIARALAGRVPGFPANLLTLDELVEEVRRRSPASQSAPAAPPGAGPEAKAVDASTASASRPAVISVRGLRHTYLRGTPRAHEALRGIDLDVCHREIVGIVGSAGSGKSTLLQHFNGLIRARPEDGRVEVLGINPGDSRADLRSLRRRAGLVFQFPERQLFERYVGDDVAFGPRQMGYDKEEVRRRVRRALERVGLDFEEFKDRVTLTLSGGQKRRVATAGVLALEPEVLVLDEPTAGLDPRGRRELLASLKRWREDEGITIVLVSHHMDEIAEVCDRVYVLDSGRVAFTGSPRELFYGGPDLGHLGLVPPPVSQVARALAGSGMSDMGSPLTETELVDRLVPKMTS